MDWRRQHRNFPFYNANRQIYNGGVSMNPDIAVISIISLAIVAIASLLGPFLSRFVIDYVKWKREANAAEMQKIDEKTVELLEILSQYRSGNVVLAAGRPVEETYSKILGQYYAWERVIWSRCKDPDRERVKLLRTRFENGNFQSLFDAGPLMANEILALAHIASERIT
jgi:hypothetical protein